MTEPEPTSPEDRTANPEEPDRDATPPDPANPAPSLSKEEQMARFEEQLKEDDWGHQPC